MQKFAAGLAFVLLVPMLAQAKRLPIRTYTTADGLARDHVLCITQDSHGFLWFCTAEGLSRFDGYQFRNYHTGHGLPSNVISDFLETSRGVYWVATSEGICRFEPSGTGSSRFHCLPVSGDHGVQSPSVLYEDASGGVWCGTSGGKGLFYIAPNETAFRRVEFDGIDATITGIVVDRRGTLWVGSSAGLYRRDANGQARTYTTADGLPNSYTMALLEDHEGRLWVGTRIGLARLESPAEIDKPLRIRLYSGRDGLPSTRIESLLETSNGTLWVGTNQGLAERIHVTSPEGREFQSYTVAEGMSARSVGALAEDRDGNLWVGTFGSGAMKVARTGFTTYTDADGVPFVGSIIESRNGELCVLSRGESDLRVARFDGRQFKPTRPRWPADISYYGWGRGQIAVHSQAGEWWIATGQGLCRFPATRRLEQLAGVRPKVIYKMEDGLPGDNIFRVFEDSRGDVWIGTIGPAPQDGLARWEHQTATLHAFCERDGLPANPVPTAFAEDHSRSIWVSLFHGGLARYRDGRFTFFSATDGIHGFVKALFVDSAGRLWIGTSLGLIRVDDPAQQRPAFVTYTTRQGLSSDYIAAIAEDRWGRIYAATGRGIDRFEPRPAGPVCLKHYTTADGIAPGELDLAFRDRNGSLWFSTALGVSQLVPKMDPPRPPPPVLVTGLSIGDVPHAISDLGQSDVAGLNLRQTPLRIDFVGLDYSSGEALRYQYMLEGTGQSWSAPTDQRTVVYASLSPGSYRFAVRAVTSDGMVSPHAASVAFTILPPVWRTWWFLTGCGVVAFLLIYALHRYRVAQLLAVANIRTRIATDLHDDIGASLSQIAILSEVAQRSTNGTESPTKVPLSEIAGISRELVDSMGDIVWAINPDHDRLSDLVYRMRRFAMDLLGAQNVGVQFHSSVTDHDLRIGTDVRRQVFLIFKEAVHNIARHSDASCVDIHLERTGDTLILLLSDDGKGFDYTRDFEGHGLVNMRKRAAALRGAVDFQSALRQGTTVRMTVRLEPPKTLAALRGKYASVSGRLKL